MNISHVLENVTKSDIEKAKEIKKVLDGNNVPWRTIVDGKPWSYEDSKIIQIITYLRLNEVK